MTGPEIREAREARGWTQTDLAERLSAALGRPVTQGEVSRWETGARKPGAAMSAVLRQVLQP